MLLRSIVRTKAGLRQCLKRCRHCGIFFLTHRRNAKRRDLRCPFGCREAHRKGQSTRRSVAYYRADKEKKREQNAKRRKPTVPAKGVAPAGAALRAQARLPWPRPILAHVRMVTSLIEGRRFSLAQIVEMLTRAVRQHRMARQRRIDQTVAWLHEEPP